MKNVYYSPENINTKSSAFLDELKTRKVFKSTEFDFENSALIVLDMQEYFTNPNSHAFVPSSNAIIPNIKSLITIYKKNNCPVIYTKHTNNEENASQMKKWWKGILSPNTPESEIVENLCGAGMCVIEKHQYDAFFDTNLETILKEKNIKQVVITGVMTHLCCETTARSAFVRGFDVFFAIDGTATYYEDFHKASILNLSHGFVTPVLVGELLEKVDG